MAQMLRPGAHILQFRHTTMIAARGRGRKGETCAILVGMAGSRCRVSFSDSDGVLHGVDVDADSLYEAVAIAVAQLREDELSPAAPNPNTEFTVMVYRQPTEHKLLLKQVLKWSEPTTRDGPAGITKRQRVRTLLGQPN